MIELLLGKDESSDTTIHYPFDSKYNPNGHALSLGGSGSGKTIASLLFQYQSIKYGIPVINFDYSCSYDNNRLEPPFTNLLEDEINRINVHDNGIGLNPFKLYQINTKSREQQVVDIAERFSEMLSSVLKLGKSQKYSIYQAIKKGLSRDWYPINNENPFIYELHKDAEGNPIMDMNALRYLLAEQSNSTSDRAIENITPLLDKQIFIPDTKHSWSNILFDKPMLTIFDLNHYSPSTQQILLELILYDLWDFIKIYGNTNRPFITVFDEAQNLNYKAGSPIAKILNEGRKFGWSSWFIMQSITQLNQDELSRLGQASLQLFFNPPQPDIHKISRLISPDTPKKYIKQLELLEKGSCLAKGTFKNEYNVTFHNAVKKITIPDASNLFKN